MTIYDRLNPLTRCFALVGHFLQSWSLMESGMRRALGKALGLDKVQEAIVTSNLQLRDKIHILKTAVNITPGMEEDRKKHFGKVLDKIGNYSAHRNMMAHDVFGPSDKTDGVEFLVTRAKGSLDFPDIHWDTERFFQAYTTLKELAGEMEQLEKELTRASLISALTLAANSPPTGAEPSPTLFGLLHHPFPDSPDSDTDPPTG